MNTAWNFPENQATLILRYFLPRPPYVDRQTTKIRLEELIAFCKDSHIDAVQMYGNFLPNWIFMPDTLEDSLEWAEEMKSYSSELRKAGISYQLNFQLILGSQAGLVDMRSLYKWEFMVDQFGNENPGCACPLGPRFRDIMGQHLRAWAGSRPDIMWIDDDFRLHHHQPFGNLADYFCYCPRHLDHFAEYYGKKLNREALVSKILIPGKVNDVRHAWLSFLNQSTSETAGWIEQQIHTISPDTRIALMTSVPDVHSIEGRNWGTLLENLSGKNYSPITRPTFGPYCEFFYLPVSFIKSYKMLDQSMKNIAMHFPHPVDFCPEVENAYWTVWGKTVQSSRFQLELGQLLGCSAITLSLFDEEGTSIDEEPRYKTLLLNEKSKLDSLARLHLKTWKPRGVNLLTDPELGHKVQIMEETGDIEALLGTGRT